jgi:hydrophobe/amphiphile efflux-1 (HAE1) family protein/NodT family efflux transporter outer membrane factor (OMF) lipoprotein
MRFSHFFIQRPIFAGVLSLLILIVGGISMRMLPVSEYPEIVPPTVVVRAVYPGANPKTIAETVAAPLEQQITGIENSLYISSQSTVDGVMTLTVTFKLGTDIDNAQVQVQNRVSQTLPKLPEEVRRLGVVTLKSSPDLTMVVHLLSPDNRYDEVYLRNYAVLYVKDELARVQGAGQVQVFGSGDYAMRVWLDPDKVAARGLTAGDVVSAIREQNVQVAAGAVGQQPVKQPVSFELTINTKGRLVTEEEFENIIVKTGPNGETLRLKEIARVELAASEYALRSLLNNKPAVAIPIFQLPGSNAIQLSDDVRAKMEELKAKFPPGVEYAVVYDPTIFVRGSIKAVVETLLEAILLVVIVVIIFLQTWRASIIPLAAVPVSLIGTFAVMHWLGFSINALSLFGLVLAIGIVVDDAIVVVENVERNIALGLSPLDATRRAMNEVSGPIIATALVLCAVFIPTAFISGLSGQFYKQFAITIAISTVISAFNSLTLSPALCAALLQPHGAKRDRLSRLMDWTLGWFFRPFNRFFEWSSRRYSLGVASVIRKSAIALLVYAGLIALTAWGFNKVPTGFVPTQDKQYLIAFAQLPDATSLDKSEAVIRRMSDIALAHPGVESAVAFPGLSISGFSVSPNAGIVFVCLKPFEERKRPDMAGLAIAGALQAQFSEIQEAFVAVFPPPAVNGLGQIGGFKLQIQDKGSLGYEALYAAVQELIGKAYQTPGLAGVFTSYQLNVPQLEADVDREKAKSQGVPLANLFETMQVYLGSLYVNDFNRFGRTYQVIAQGDAEFRDSAKDITRLKTRNSKGEMVPLGALVKVKETYGPDRAMHYNGYTSADLNGAPAPGYSSGQAEAIIAKLARETLPPGINLEWTELVYQKILAGNTSYLIYPLCIVLVFLVLAAQYESLRLPLAIILIVPLCLLFAIAGVFLSRSDNNIFTQIGLIVLVGLACKNAILIVEFAKHKQDEGLSPAEAALEACRLRLRPILMTSIAFIAGVFPLVISTGAGAEMRRAMGTAVFSGMIGVTLFGLFLTPVFYVVLMKLSRKPAPAPDQHPGVLGPRSIAPGAALFLACALTAGAFAKVGPEYIPPFVEAPRRYKNTGPLSDQVDVHALALERLRLETSAPAITPPQTQVQPASPAPSVPLQRAPAELQPAAAAAADQSSEMANRWKPGEPRDHIAKDRWWELFNDPVLTHLIGQASSGNFDLRAALARVEQARATARIRRGELFPEASAKLSASRERYSPNQEPGFGPIIADNIRVPLDLSYEIDLFGRVRRGFEAARAEAEASAAAFHNLLLTLQGDLAMNYFRLRALDSEIETVGRNVGLRREQLDMVTGRVNAGVGNDLDVARARSELATAEAEAAALSRQRAEVENALAILTGNNPSEFRLDRDARNGAFWNPLPPPIPIGLPSGLLERRPDVAEAERQIAAANARIGIAKAASFPVIRLTGTGGFVSGEVQSLFDWDSRIWSIGPSVSVPLFAGGRNRANRERAAAAYEEALMRYRQRVLVAFSDVENSLAAIRFLGEQKEAQDRALQEARHAAQLAQLRYQAGIVGYLDVVDANRAVLQNERATVQLAGQRLTSTVQLIKALGGGWRTGDPL